MPLDLGDASRRRLDDDERDLGRGQLLADQGADPAETGDDRVAAEHLDLPPHALVPQELLDLAFGQELDEAARACRRPPPSPGR